MNLYDWAHEAHPEPVPTTSRQRRDGTDAGDPGPASRVAGTLRAPSSASGGAPSGDPVFRLQGRRATSPREPAGEGAAGRAVGQSADPARVAHVRHVHRAGSAPLRLAAAVAVCAAAAVGVIRAIEWVGATGTWVALAVVYGVSLTAGVVIAVFARPVILGDPPDHNEPT